MRLLLLIFILVLSACGGDAPVRQPFYSYTPPMTPGGVMCIDQCRKSHDYCGEACGLDYRACVNDVQAMGQREFDAYAQQQFAAHVPVARNPSDFEHTDVCVADRKRCLADCDAPYNSCYKSCGGRMDDLTAPACSFLCFE